MNESNDFKKKNEARGQKYWKHDKDSQKNHLKSPRKLLVKDQSTRPAQLPIKNGRETHVGWLIPTIS